MRKIRGLKLNTKLLVMFFAALFLVSLVSSVVFVRLLNTLEEELRAINTEQLTSTMNRMDVELSGLISGGKNVMRLDEFRSVAGLSPSAYKLREMMIQAERVLSSMKHHSGWVIFFRNTDQVLSSDGMTDMAGYTDKKMAAEGYDSEFWLSCMESRFSRAFFPETVFTSLHRTNAEDTVKAVPLAMKSYWDNDMLIVVYLDMDQLTQALEVKWDESYYIFSDAGQLLYHSSGTPLIDAVPEEAELERDGELLYVLKSPVSESGLQLVRLVPESDAAGLVKSSLAIFLGTMLVSLAVVSVIFAVSLRTAIYPVNDMLDLLARHSGIRNTGDPREARNALHQVLKNLEDQGRALAQKDAVLSEYLLHSQLKNVHVNAGIPVEETTGDTYILFIQIRYRSGTRNDFGIRRAELESMLQDMLSGILRRLFETTLIFQVEPGRFAARVTLPQGDASIEEKMEQMMARLEQEREFAWFTVVRSQVLGTETDLSEVYAGILEGARQAKIREESQLLILPLQESSAETIDYSRTDEQRLQAAVLTRQTEAAADCAGEILERNFRKDICYDQLETLCVALVNTVASAAAEGTRSQTGFAAAAGVLNIFATKCDTARSYYRTVTDFIFEIVDKAETGEESDPLLERVRRYLEEHYQRDFSVEQMADDLNVSRSHLSTYYKNKTGINLSDSIQMYRVEMAMELLKDPAIRTGDVGEMVGFGGKNTFLRQFKKYTGMTPKEFQIKTNSKG